MARLKFQRSIPTDSILRSFTATAPWRLGSTRRRVRLMRRRLTTLLAKGRGRTAALDQAQGIGRRASRRACRQSTPNGVTQMCPSAAGRRRLASKKAIAGAERGNAAGPGNAATGDDDGFQV